MGSRWLWARILASERSCPTDIWRFAHRRAFSVCHHGSCCHSPLAQCITLIQVRHPRQSGSAWAAKVVDASRSSSNDADRVVDCRGT